jgi:hypothetical protein
MTYYFQGSEKGRDEEVVFFSGEADQRAAADYKCMKMSAENQVYGVLGTPIMMQ